MGLLVEVTRAPTKIEGNPDHPSSRGATDLFASLDPRSLRSRPVAHDHEPRRHQAVQRICCGDARSAHGAGRQQGSGIRILTETVASPTLAVQMQEFLTRFPEAKWIQWEPVGRHNAREGSRLAFGEYVDPHYSIEKADVILSLDADFLCTGASGLRHSRAFASRRRLEGDQAQLNRLYAVESDATNTGSRADHRLPLKASEIETFTRTVASQLGVAGAGAQTLSQAAAPWIEPLVKDLQANRGRGVVIAGDGQRSMRARARDEQHGSIGARSARRRLKRSRWISARDYPALVNDMNARSVGLLFILGGNPVYTAPVDLKLDACEGWRPRAPWAPRGRDICPVPVAHLGNALPRVVERRPVRRWDGHDRPAADRAVVRQQVRPRSHVGVERQRREIGIRPGPRVLEQSGCLDGKGHARARRTDSGSSCNSGRECAIRSRLAQVAA
jgi:molybdopterin-containing oxidoreductase family iron-sulfur binding subunit